MRTNNRISTRSVSQDVYNLEVAYICIPQDVDRDEYVSRCLKNGVVAIKNESGLFEKDVFISRNLLNEIEFPDSPFILGTCVLFTRINFHSSPIIISVLSSKVNLTGHTYENQFIFTRKGKKENSNSFASIAGWGIAGVLDLSASSIINISSISSSQDNQLNIYSSGDVNIYSFRDTNNRYVSNYKIISATIDGQFTNLQIDRENIVLQNSNSFLKIENNAGVSIKADSVKIGNQATLEKAVKGESLVDQLKIVLDNFSNLITNLANFSTIQAAASSSVTLTGHLAIAFTNLSVSVNLIKSQVDTIKAQLAQEVLSENVKNS